VDDTAAGEAGAFSADERMVETDGAGVSREDIDVDGEAAIKAAGASITSGETGDTAHVTGAAAGEPSTSDKTGDKDHIARAELNMVADTGGQSGSMAGRKDQGKIHQAPGLKLSAQSLARVAEADVDGGTGSRQAEAAANGDGASRGEGAGATSAGGETADDVQMEEAPGDVQGFR